MRGSSFMEPIKKEDNKLVDLEVDGLVETWRKFDCSFKGLKSRIEAQVSYRVYKLGNVN
jgi:hypothetical protein